MTSSLKQIKSTQLVRRCFEQKHYDNLLQAGYPPLAARVLAARGISSTTKLDPNLSDLAPATGETVKAASLIASAVESKKQICVIGDYDADGMCAISTMMLALQAINGKVDWLISSRNHSERSLDPSLVEEAVRRKTELIITVDGGTNSHQGVEAAHRNEIEVIITDHHKSAQQTTPVSVAALVNPELSPILKNDIPGQRPLCGTAVALLVLRECYRILGTTQPVGSLFDLAAVATIADSMPLDDQLNRKLVMNGLNLIRKGRCRNLFKVIFDKNHSINTTNLVSFRIAPMLNAAHRLGNPETGVQALLADNERDANRLYSELNNCNRSRKQISHKVNTEAIAAVNNPNMPIVVYKENWHKGVLGITANRLVTEFQQPAIVLSGSPGSIQGSARSDSRTSLHSTLSAIADEDPEILSRWGGHEHAAGVQLSGSVERLRELFQKHCQTSGTAHTFTLETDGELTGKELVPGSFEKLAYIPWGSNFSQPTFVGNFNIQEVIPTYNSYRYQLVHKENNTSLPAWSFGYLGKKGESVCLLYEVELDKRNNSGLFIFPRQIVED